jgi:hypothetical protein
LTRGSQKIKEQVLTLDCQLSKFIEPVLNLNWGSKKSKNQVKEPTLNHWLFHENHQFFKKLKKTQNRRFI